MINETKQNSSFSGLNNTGDETYYYGSDGDDGTGNYYQPLEYYYFYAKKYEYVEDGNSDTRLCNIFRSSYYYTNKHVADLSFHLPKFPFSYHCCSDVPGDFGFHHMYDTATGGNLFQYG